MCSLSELESLRLLFQHTELDDDQQVEREESYWNHKLAVHEEDLKDGQQQNQQPDQKP